MTGTGTSQEEFKVTNDFNFLKDLSRNKLCILALRFRSDLFDPKTQNHRNSSNYFEDFVRLRRKDRAKMA